MRSSLVHFFRFVCAVVWGWFEGASRRGQLKRRVPALGLALDQAHKPGLELGPIRGVGQAPPHSSGIFLIHQGLEGRSKRPGGELWRDVILHLNCMLSRPVGRASCRALAATKHDSGHRDLKYLFFPAFGIQLSAREPPREAGGGSGDLLATAP